MCEIIIIVLLCMKINTLASEKGRWSVGYILLLLVGWLGGAFIVATFGVILNRGQVTLAAYGCALVGEVIGIGSVFALVALLPPVEDDDYDRPRRRRKRRRIHDEDEYEEERRPRRRDDDEDGSYRDKFRSRPGREPDDTVDDEDEGRYRRKRRGSEEY